MPRPTPSHFRPAVATVLAAVLALAAAGAQAGKLYRWTDRNGVTHYGDRAPSQTAAAAAGAAAQQSAIRGALAASGWDDLAAVTAPITLVRGERGFVTPADADEFRRRLPSATLVDAPSGHNVQEEAPVLLAALIGDIARD